MLQRSNRTHHGLPRIWLEALLLAAGYALYQFIQILVVGQRQSAVGRATWLWSTEQHLHVLGQHGVDFREVDQGSQGHHEHGKIVGSGVVRT